MDGWMACQYLYLYLRYRIPIKLFFIRWSPQYLKFKFSNVSGNMKFFIYLVGSDYISESLLEVIKLKFWILGLEPWSSGYGWWLIFERLWVRTPVLCTGPILIFWILSSYLTIGKPNSKVNSKSKILIGSKFHWNFCWPKVSPIGLTKKSFPNARFRQMGYVWLCCL